MTAKPGATSAQKPTLRLVPSAEGAEPADADVCVCGHPKSAHEHYRKGTECALCDVSVCGAYRPAKGKRSWFQR
ncbi:hypothetical protein [Propionicimonas sp.]|uniref:hypothetical protein n=1 Tax=Propionicimonas sp. TaxID=1955623 RepID=UPI0039E682B9